MWLVAAMGTALCFGINNTIFKWSSTKHLSKINIQFFFYLLSFIVISFYGLMTDTLHFSLLAILLGGIAGICNANGNIQMVKAFEKGPISITSSLIASNSIIPILAALIMYPEQVHLIHWLGIGLLVLSSILIQYKPGTWNSLERREYKGWLLHLLLSLLSFGMVGTIMNIASHQHISLLDMLFALYGGGVLYLAFFLRRETFQSKEIKVASIVGLLSISGFSLYLFALQQGPASIVYPIISLNCLVVIAAGILLYKEKLKYYQYAGIIMALIGLLLIKS